MNNKTVKRRSYSDHDKETARKYYFKGLNLPDISKLMEIPVKTLEKWQQKEKWANAREIDSLKIKARELKQRGYPMKEISKLLKISLTTIWRYTKE